MRRQIRRIAVELEERDARQIGRERGASGHRREARDDGVDGLCTCPTELLGSGLGAADGVEVGLLRGGGHADAREVLRERRCRGCRRQREGAGEGAEEDGQATTHVSQATSRSVRLWCAETQLTWSVIVGVDVEFDCVAAVVAPPDASFGGGAPMPPGPFDAGAVTDTSPLSEPMK